ncbi:MAG: hypothetical protein ACRC2T_07535, partial [Thermoguttaceae bacterium]
MRKSVVTKTVPIATIGLVIFFQCLVLWVGSALTQEIKSPNQENDKQIRFKESPLQVWFVNKNGNLIATIKDFTLNEIEKRLFEIAKTEAPLYSIQKIEATGTVNDEIAQIWFDVTIRTNNEPIVLVPIGLSEGVRVINSKPQNEENENASGAIAENNSNINDTDKKEPDFTYNGQGSCELNIDQKSSGYIFLIRNSKNPAPVGAENSGDSSEANTALSGSTTQNVGNTSSGNSSDENLRDGLDDSREHKIGFKLAFPVAFLAQDEYRVKLTFPESVSSRLLLTAPMPSAVPTLIQGSGMLLPTTFPNEESTKFEIQGVNGNTELAWRKVTPQQQDERPTVIQVEDARINVSFTDHETIFDATIPVRNVGGVLKRFQITLPTGSHLVQDTSNTQGPTEYQLSEIASETGVPTVEVIRIGPEKPDATLMVRLRASRPFNNDVDSVEEEFAGFNVIDAKRQSGRLILETPYEKRINWEAKSGIRLDAGYDTVTGLSVSPQREGVTTIPFTYYSQPFSLLAKVVSPQTRVRIKPEYQILIDNGQVTLYGKLAATVSGAKLNQLQLNISDWELDDIGPANVIDAVGIVYENDKGLISIPIMERSDFEITFTASRFLKKGENNRAYIEFPIPLPIVDRIEPGNVTITPADNVELVTNTQNNVGLTPLPRGVSAIKYFSTAKQQEPLVYRIDMMSPELGYKATFSSDLLFHKQEVSASSRSNIRLLDAEEQVKQTITYNVQYEPLNEIVLQVPKSIEELGGVKFTFDDKPIESRQVDTLDSLGSSFVRRRITLPTPLIGTGVLTARYSIERIEVQKQWTTMVNIPLIVPDDTTRINLIDQIAAVTVQNGINVFLSEKSENGANNENNTYLDSVKGSNGKNGVSNGVNNGVSIDGNNPNLNAMSSVQVKQDVNNAELKSNALSARSWKSIDKNESFESGMTGFFFSTNRWENAVGFNVQLNYYGILGTTVVDRAWIQTWLTDKVRVDRAIFQITSDLETITLILPSGFDKNRVQVLWDNTICNPLYNADGELQINQRSEERGKPHMLNVKYQMSGESIGNWVSVELPYFDEDVWVRRTYWQLILPRTNLVLGNCEGWTSEFQWGWNGFFWDRKPSLGQNELELWSGVSENQKIPTETNQYLFSGFKPPEHNKFFIVNRSHAILVSSGVVLLAGLLLIYIPRLRNIGVLFALIVLLFAILIYQPTPVLLVLQASVLGIVLALLAAIFAKILVRNDQWKSHPLIVPPSVATEVGGASSSHEVLPQVIIADTSSKHSNSA